MNSAHATPWFVPGPEIMDLPARLDSSTAAQFEEDALLCIMSGAQEMILDAAKLSYVTGAGMRAFLVLAQALHNHGGKLAIRNMKPQVKEFFDASGYDCVMCDEGEKTAPRLALVA